MVTLNSSPPQDSRKRKHPPADPTYWQHRYEEESIDFVRQNDIDLEVLFSKQYKEIRATLAQTPKNV